MGLGFHLSCCRFAAWRGFGVARVLGWRGCGGMGPWRHGISGCEGAGIGCEVVCVSAFVFRMRFVCVSG